MSTKRVHVLAIAATTLLPVLSACGGAAQGAAPANTVTIVGYAVPEAANRAAAEQFVATPQGKGARFRSSYGASGEQSRAVLAGLNADYVHFSVPSDVQRLVEAGLVDEAWDKGPNRGVVSTSVVVFGVRKGNPLNIRDWADLARPGVELVTPNPASSGAARWNALAAWAQATDAGGSESEAKAYVEDLYANAVALPTSGRDATSAFTGGTGDVLLTYENEAILARQNGEDFDYVIPSTTLLIENPGAVLVGASPMAKRWMDFVTSTPGQEAFASKGFRPLPGVDGVSPGRVAGASDPRHAFPKPKRILTVTNDVGPWPSVNKKFFDDKTGIISLIIANSGRQR